MLNKIFYIGFNRCATLSLASFFADNSLDKNSVTHWDYGRLASKMYKNFLEKKTLLSGLESKIFYLDMECCVEENNKKKWVYMYKHFRLLDEQYPNSKFILNIRNLNNWIDSRKNWLIWHENEWNSYAEVLAKIENLNQEELFKKWKREWSIHNIEVANYFKQRPTDLLIYDIDKDNPQKIINFFSNDLKFKHSKFDHLNKSFNQKINTNKKPKQEHLINNIFKYKLF